MRVSDQTEGEGKDFFSQQYAQRRKGKKVRNPVTCPTASRQKRGRENDDAVDDSLSTRPTSIAKHFMRK